MTANYIAKVVESFYNKMDLDEMKSSFKHIQKYDTSGRITDDWINARIENRTYLRWCMAINVLENYCYLHFDTFEETELVYRWAKKVCIQRNEELNKRRSFLK